MQEYLKEFPNYMAEAQSPKRAIEMLKEIVAHKEEILVAMERSANRYTSRMHDEAALAALPDSLASVRTVFLEILRGILEGLGKTMEEAMAAVVDGDEEIAGVFSDIGKRSGQEAAIVAFNAAGAFMQERDKRNKEFMAEREEVQKQDGSEPTE